MNFPIGLLDKRIKYILVRIDSLLTPLYHYFQVFFHCNITLPCVICYQHYYFSVTTTVS